MAEADALCRRILEADPRHADAWNLRGGIAYRAGRPDVAAEMFGRAVALDGKVALYHYNFGNALARLGRLDDAVTSYERAVALAPDHAGALINLGGVLLGLGRFDAAALRLRRAVVLAPDRSEPHANLGLALLRRGDTEAAVECFEAALALAPDNPGAHANLGSAKQQQGQLEPALTHFERGMALAPGEAGIHTNRGNVLQMLGRLDEAATAHRRALALRPDFADAEHNLATVLLADGRYEEGWPAYESRWRTGQQADERRDFRQPQWRGETGRGGTLLIHAEQGLGDTLQFCRYAPLAAAKGWRVVLEAPAPLVGLLGSLDGVAQVVPPGRPLPPFDAHCPMLSLPLALGTTLSSIPAAIPYLRAAPQLELIWRERLGSIAGEAPRIGLAWAGNPNLGNGPVIDRWRSMAPDLLAPLFAFDGIAFFSLQKGGPKAPARAPIFDVMDQVDDFADTAALVANLDLVITVDTAIVHLAGALGKPVWLLDRFSPCWRWLRNREDSPWYPTLRLFRQTRLGDWPPVVERVGAALAAWAADR